MGALFTLAIVLYTIVCVLLILLVIIQGGKAEGLFSSSQSNVLGSQSANVLTKATRVLSTIFIVGALVISIVISSQKTAFETVDANKESSMPLIGNESVAPITNDTNTVQDSIPATPLVPATPVVPADTNN